MSEVWQWLGRVDYADAVARMEALRARILDGDAAAETLLLLEHPPTITLGRRARAEHIVVLRRGARRARRRRRRNRRAAATSPTTAPASSWPTRSCACRRASSTTSCRLAKAAIAVAAAYGVDAPLRSRAPRRLGARAAKLAAVGVHVHRRVAIHGLALNVTTALDAFDLIVPCGLRDIQRDVDRRPVRRHTRGRRGRRRFAEAFAAPRRSDRCAVSPISRCFCIDSSVE